MAKEILSRLMSLKQVLFCQETLLRCCTFIEFTSYFLFPEFPPFLLSTRDFFVVTFLSSERKNNMEDLKSFQNKLLLVGLALFIADIAAIFLFGN